MKMKKLICMLITVIILLGSMQMLVFAETQNDVKQGSYPGLMMTIIKSVLSDLD